MKSWINFPHKSGGVSLEQSKFAIFKFSFPMKMGVLLAIGICFSQLSIAGVGDFKTTSLEARSLTRAAEEVLGDYKAYYANIENILYLRHLEENKITAPNEFWQAALDELALNRLMESFVNIGWIEAEENPMAVEKDLKILCRIPKN